MANRGRPKAPLELSDDERAALQRTLRRRKASQHLTTRSRVVLLAADGLPDTEIAERVGHCRQTVARWRTRFLERRLDGLYDERKRCLSPIGQSQTIASDVRRPLSRETCSGFAKGLCRR